MFSILMTSLKKIKTLDIAMRSLPLWVNRAMSSRTLLNNTVDEQNNKTARAKYNPVGFSAVLSKATT